MSSNLNSHRNFFLSVLKLYNLDKNIKLSIDSKEVDIFYSNNLVESITLFHCTKNPHLTTFLSITKSRSFSTVEIFNNSSPQSNYRMIDYNIFDIIDWLNETDDMDDVLIRLSETKKIRAFDTFIINGVSFTIKEVTNIINSLIDKLNLEWEG